VISLLDNTVLSNFSVIQRPDLLRTAFEDNLATPQQAFDELQAGIRAGKLPPDLHWQWLPVWALSDRETPHYQQFLQRLWI
jgi:predicted nucleic acid-binding protein